MTRARSAVLASTLIGALAVSAPAAGHVYWANGGGTSVGRADNEGGNPRQAFVAGATAPRSVAIDGSYVYWAQTVAGVGKIGRAPLDGSGPPEQGFLSVGDPPLGLATDAGLIYWTHTAAGSGRIGRTSLSGSGPQFQSFIPTGPSPCGVTVEPDHLYWANGGTPGAIGIAHGPLDVEQDFVTDVPNPCGVATAAGWIYWAAQGGNAIGRTNLAGDADPGFIATGAGNSPCGVAVDETYVYWTTPANGTIWRRPIDRNGTNEPIVTGAASPCGIAVDATATVTPGSHTFAPTTVGGTSDIQALFVANTSSSTMRVASVALVGLDPGDFIKTGDGCSLSRIAPGGGCVINVRFAPTDLGPRGATLRVASSASDSPLDVVLVGDAVAPTISTVGTTTSGAGVVGSGSSSSGGSTAEGPIPLPAPDLGGPKQLSPRAGLRGLRSAVVVNRSGEVRLATATNPPTVATTQTLGAPVSAGRARQVVLGRGRTAIPVGRRAAVVVRLGARGRRALRSRRTIVVRAEIVARGADGSNARVKRRVRLWAAGAKRY